MTTETERYDPAFPVAKLHESPLNPRKTFKTAKMDELIASVKAKGVVTPLLLRANGTGADIAAGHRRARAAKAAGLATVPALLRTMTDAEYLELLVFENDEREDVHPLEEAAGYRTLMTELRWDVGRIAARSGKSDKYVYDRVKLLALVKEAQALFLDDKMTAAHAILLARLKPEDQRRILVIDTEVADESVLLKRDAVLLTTDEEETLEEQAERGKGQWPLKAISVRELERWIAEHVRFKPVDTDPFLFPETSAAVATAMQTKKKVVEITHESFIQEDAREGRTIRAGYWKRADGQQKTKTCERSATGVIVVGPGQGEAFEVCVDRERCAVHWGAEITAKAKRAKDGATGRAPSVSKERDRYAREEAARKVKQAQEEAERARWKKALPAILKAVAASVKKAPTKAGGLLAEIVLGALTRDTSAKAAAEFVPRGSNAEDLVRHAAFIVLHGEASHLWSAPEHFPKQAKAFGIDVKKILDAEAPGEKAAKGGAKGKK